MDSSASQLTNNENSSTTEEVIIDSAECNICAPMHPFTGQSEMEDGEARGRQRRTQKSHDGHEEGEIMMPLNRSGRSKMRGSSKTRSASRKPRSSSRKSRSTSRRRNTSAKSTTRKSSKARRGKKA